MKSVVLAAVCVLCVAGGALAQTADEQAVMNLEREWERAIKARDQAALSRIVADDAVIVSSIGELMTKAQAAIETQLTTLNDSQILDMKVRIFGEVAVVIGSNAETSKNRSVETSGLYRWMDVFVKREGRWQVVAAQSTRIE